MPQPNRQFEQRIRPEYMMAATGEREKAKARARAPKAKQAFAKSHEGPREQIAKPKLICRYTPSGKTVHAVHTAHDREKIRRNREKDNQMQQWRTVKIGLERKFNTRGMRPMHLRPKRTPEVFRAQGARGRHFRENNLNQGRET